MLTSALSSLARIYSRTKFVQIRAGIDAVIFRDGRKLKSYCLNNFANDRSVLYTGCRFDRLFDRLPVFWQRYYFHDPVDDLVVPVDLNEFRLDAKAFRKCLCQVRIKADPLAALIFIIHRFKIRDAHDKCPFVLYVCLVALTLTAIV